MIASIRPIGAYVSSTEVMMWITRKTSASSEARRCTPSVRNRGQYGEAKRATSATPERDHERQQTAETPRRWRG